MLVWISEQICVIFFFYIFPDFQKSSKSVVLFRISRKRKHTFVLSFSHELTHPLISYIQSALNTHHCPLELLEILERTTIPMSIVSGLMESKLLSAKYHRQDQLAAEGKALAAVAEKASSSNGKKGGKGMKLGYKGKFGGKGMRLGYTSDKLLGSDEKQFTPSDLVLIPRSQNRIKLAYSNRCSVDIWFLAVSLKLNHVLKDMKHCRIK